MSIGAPEFGTKINYSQSEIDEARRAFGEFLQGGKKDIARFAPYWPCISYLQSGTSDPLTAEYVRRYLTAEDIKAIQFQLVHDYKVQTEGKEAADRYLEPYEEVQSKESKAIKGGQRSIFSSIKSLLGLRA